MRIKRYLEDNVFAPDDIRMMSTAFEDVCRILKADGGPKAKEVIAVRIIELTRRGERDPAKLRDRVLREAGEDGGASAPA